MNVPGKSRGPSLIISQKFTVHGHVLEEHQSRVGRVADGPLHSSLETSGPSNDQYYCNHSFRFHPGV